jgi:hypothetical protein
MTARMTDPHPENRKIEKPVGHGAQSTIAAYQMERLRIELG